MYSTGAGAQTSTLLEAVRTHRPEATALARAELEGLRRVRPGRAGNKDPARQLATRRLSLLLGHLLVSDGALEEARAVLAGAPPPPGLEPIHGWTLAAAQAWSGQRAAALATLSRARRGAPPWLVPRITLRIAELELDLGRPARAVGLFEEALARERSPVVLYGLALSHLGLGRRAAAVEALRELCLRFPAHPHADAAERLFQRFGRPRPWTREERVRRGEALLEAGRTEAALQALEAPEVPPPSPGSASARGRGGRLAAREQLARAGALAAAGRAAEAELVLERLAASDGPGASEALMRKARRLMRRDDSAGAAVALFDAVAERFPDDDDAPEAAYLAAWLAMSQGELADAVGRFKRFEERFARARRRDEARWFRGYSLFRSGATADARTVLRSIPQDFPRSQLVPQALYWAALAARREATARPATDAGAGAAPTASAVPVPGVADGGATPTARDEPQWAAEFRALLTAFPGSLYAQFALARLREAGLEAAEPFSGGARPPPPGIPAPAPLRLAIELAQTGLFPAAAEETRATLERVRTGPEALLWAQALQRAGDFASAHALAARHLWGEAYTEQSPDALALLYPRAWREPVEAFAVEHGIDSHFVWAIMRRESAFRPDVRSTADARGLMQIIPPTARAIAKRLSAPLASPDELYSPLLNVRFGVWYLRALEEKLAHPALVAAAYNAGPSAVTRWLEGRKERPLDEWIEEIPFRETRTYVKQVLADAYIYRRLYSKEAGRAPPWELPSPRPGGVSF